MLSFRSRSLLVGMIAAILCLSLLGSNVVQNLWVQNSDGSISPGGSNTTVKIGATVIVNCGGVDDTAALQSELTAAGGHVMVGAPGGVCTLTGALTIYSNTWLDMGTTTLNNPATTGPEMIENYAANHSIRTVSDAAIIAASTTFTSATAAFTSADVGRSITVEGAGALGGTSGSTAQRLCALILTVSNGTTVTISVAATTSVSGVSATVWPRDTNITITGGTITNGGSFARGGSSLIILRRVDGLRISGLNMSANMSQYAIYPQDVTNMSVDHVNLKAPADTFHVEGPASNIVVRDSTFVCSDDALAFTAIDTPGLFDATNGSISGVLVDNVMATSSPHALLFLGGPGSTLRDLTVRKLTQTILTAIGVGIGGSYGFTSPTDIGRMVVDGMHGGGIYISYTTLGRDLVVRNSFISRGQNGNGGIVYLTQSSAFESIVMDGIHMQDMTVALPGVGINVGSSVTDLLLGNAYVSYPSGAPSASPLVNVGGTVTNLRLSNLRADYANGLSNQALVYVNGTGTHISVGGLRASFSGTGSTGAGVHVDTGGSVSSLTADGLEFDFVSTAPADSVLWITGTGILTHYALSNVRMNGGRGVLGFESSTSTVGSGEVANAVIITPDRMGNIHVSACDVTLTNVTLDTPAETSFFVSGTTTLTLRGSGITAIGGWTGFQLGSGSPVVHVLNPDYPVNVTQLAKGNGDKAYNTTGGSCGVGPIISDGSTFKNLFSGAGC